MGWLGTRLRDGFTRPRSGVIVASSPDGVVIEEIAFRWWRRTHGGWVTNPFDQVYLILQHDDDGGWWATIGDNTHPATGHNVLCKSRGAARKFVIKHAGEVYRIRQTVGRHRRQVDEQDSAPE